MERDHNCKLRSKLGYRALGQRACFLCVTGALQHLLEVYSPECVEGEFSEVRMQNRA
jgi:hypothetical protein